MKKRKVLNWKKYWFCGIPLIIFIIIGCVLTFVFNLPIIFEFIFVCVGAGITFSLVEKYAVEEFKE